MTDASFQRMSTSSSAKTRRLPCRWSTRARRATRSCRHRPGTGSRGASLTINEGEILVLMGCPAPANRRSRAVNGLAPVVRAGKRQDRERIAEPLSLQTPSLCATSACIRSRWCSQPVCASAVANGGGQCRLRLELAGVADAERRKRVGEQLETVNLAKWADRKVNELSAACSSGSASQEPSPPAPRSC